MTKEQKILMLLVLLVAGGGVSLYLLTQNAVTPLETQEMINKTGNTTTKGSATTTQVPVTTIPAKDPSTGAFMPPMGIPKNINAPHLSNVTYVIPEKGTETIHVTLFVKEGLIQDVRFTFDPASTRQSGEYLSAFSKALAVANLKGQKVNEVSLSRVGGASLTTDAFMKAVTEINVKIGS